MNLKYCNQTNRLMSEEDWHRRQIRLSWLKFYNCVKRYLSYKGQFIKNCCKKITKALQFRKNAAFAEKLEYWRNNKTLEVVTGDTIDPFLSHADGKYYTSRKKYRQELNAMGYEEVGNDTQEHLKSRKVFEEQKQEREIKEQVERLMDGY